MILIDISWEKLLPSLVWADTMHNQIKGNSYAKTRLNNLFFKWAKSFGNEVVTKCKMGFQKQQFLKKFLRRKICLVFLFWDPILELIFLYCLHLRLSKRLLRMINERSIIQKIFLLPQSRTQNLCAWEDEPEKIVNRAWNRLRTAYESKHPKCSYKCIILKKVKIRISDFCYNNSNNLCPV